MFGGFCHGSGMFSSQVSEKLGFFKKPKPLVFLRFIGFWALLGFSDFLFERAVGKLVI